MGGSEEVEERDFAPPARWTTGSSFGREENSTTEVEGTVLLARTCS